MLSSFLFAGGGMDNDLSKEMDSATGNWSFEIEPYLMLTNIDGNAKFGRLPTTSLNVDFSTILNNLDMAAMVHAEAHHTNGWGMWIDYGFMNLSNDIDPIERVSSAKVRQGVLEVMGVYRVPVKSGYLEYLAGIRWWDNDYDIGYTMPMFGKSGTVSKKVDWIDGMVGLRYTHIIDSHWKLRAHGDIGGGGADFTAACSLGFIYSVNRMIDIDFKYKATWVDYEEGTEGMRDYFVYDTVTHGPIIGVNIKF